MKNYLRESWLDSRLEVRSSPIHGKGFFVTQPIRPNEVVIVFGGTLFSKADIEAGKANRRTLMQTDEELWIGNRADEPEGQDYFVNHSCEPNLWMRDEVTLVARREIVPGEEVTMDYAMHFGDPDWIMKTLCCCGSSHCRRTISGNDWLLHDLQTRYAGHFSPFLNRRIKRLQGG